MNNEHQEKYKITYIALDDTCDTSPHIVFGGIRYIARRSQFLCPYFGLNLFFNVQNGKKMRRRVNDPI